MARHIIIVAIRAYQLFISPFISQIIGSKTICRFNPTCSEYMIRSIKKVGLLKGVKRGLLQLSRCHPLAKTYGQYI